MTEPAVVQQPSSVQRLKRPSHKFRRNVQQLAHQFRGGFCIKHRKSTAGLDATDATVIELGRQIFRDHKVTPELFAKAKSLFGPHKLIELVMLMGNYAGTAALFFGVATPPNSCCWRRWVSFRSTISRRRAPCFHWPSRHRQPGSGSSGVCGPGLSTRLCTGLP